MQKFLSIPVTDEQRQLVAVEGIVLVEQASTTTVVIQYANAAAVTITHATAGSGVETERDAIQDAIVAALKQPWDEPVYEVGASGKVQLPFAVSGIAVAFTAQPNS